MSRFNIEKFRSHFPIFDQKSGSKEIVYFDNAATTQKPKAVLDKYAEYYSQYNANVHRASHQLSAKSTSAFEQSRQLVHKYINSKHLEEIIWTKGTTESVNLLSQSLGHLCINVGDEIIVSQSEHHANIVPWQILAEHKQAILRVVPLTDEGLFDLDVLKEMISSKTKVVSFAHVSNVIGKINPVKDIVSLCKQHKVISIVDGAQAIAHLQVDVQALDCDFYLFSTHKMYGPTGVGVLYGKKELLNKMPPYHGGGEMIKKVSFSGTTYNALPFKFEAGTPNISGIVAFSSALSFLESNSVKALFSYEEELTKYCYQKLLEISSLKFIYPTSPHVPVFSFVIESQHNHDVATYLDAHGIAVRSGHHCAMPLMESLGLDGCIRVSLAGYNTFDEVDHLIDTLNSFSNSESYTSFSDASIAPQSMKSEKASDRIIHQFSTIKGWDTRHREIMLMGKNHPRMDSAFKSESNLIQGCESSAWLSYKVDNGLYQFQADSDAKIIRGLLSIVLAAFNGKTKDQILAFDVEYYFECLGLTQHLSPSRANGLKAIVEKIYAISKE